MKKSNVDNTVLKSKLDALIEKKILECVYIEALEKTQRQDFDEEKEEIVYFYNKGEYTSLEETFDFKNNTYMFYSDEEETYNHCVELDTYRIDQILETVNSYDFYASIRNSYITIKGTNFKYKSYKKFKKLINKEYALFIK